MLSKNVRGLLLFSILILLIIIPISFAQDSDALILDEQSGDDFILILTDGNEISNSSYDYYFDASVESDGNGSLESPYKYLTDARIKDNSVIHLASGQYDFAPSKTHSNVSIYGENSLINGNGKSLITDKYFSLNNITLVNLPVENRATFIASNVVFANSTGKASDSYGNSYGGAIYCTNNVTSIALDNCIFENTSAAYGGAIYAVGCSLDVRNCIFYNCTSHNFAGAISCKGTQNIVISKSKFIRCYSNVDAGGALSIVSSKINGTDLEFIGCNATLGGAITSLGCEVYLNGIKCINNSAINGGALYHMYGNLTLTNSIFINNSAINGGASFIDNSQSLLLKNNYFINNTASYCAGAILSILNEFIEPLNNTFLGNSAQIMDDEFISSDIIITIGSGNYTMFRLNSTSYDQLPARYSLVDEGYSTSVKNQESGGNCWAYATMAVLESCILKASNVTYDLSEGNMKNLMALYSDYGWNINPNDGGNDWMAGGYLTSWLGPVNESDDESDDISFVSPVLNSILHVQNILYLYRDNYTDNDALKEAILNYGAVWSSMAMYGSYLKYSTNAYYCYSNEQSNHAVAIVGWDDNYSKSNFAKAPLGDGAWIVKNSWGDAWGDKGYFYVSYYDTRLAQPKQTDGMHTFILNDTIRYDRNYQYDISGKTDYFLNSTSTVWYKNVFIAIGDEYLAAVSTYFEKITNWTITVNVNNEFSTSKSGTSNPGYFTIELDDFVPLKEGDFFEVIFKITVDGDAGIPISEIYNFNNMAYSQNVSYASWDGLNWTDLFDLEFKYSNHWYASQAACLKAFTFINIINTTLSLTISDDLNVIARVVDQYGNVLKRGNILFNLNGIDYVLNITDGTSVLRNSLLNQTHNVIVALFSETGYNSSTALATVDIPKTNVNMSLSITKFLYDATICLESSNNINTSLIIKINDKDYPVIISNGKGYLNLTGFENDLYHVNVKCEELSAYQFDDLSDSFEINVKNTKFIFSNLVTFECSGEFFNVTLTDENGAVLTDKELVIVLDNMTYFKNTDSNGNVSIPINLSNGEYSIDISFTGDANYLPSNQSGNIKVKMNVDIDISVGRTVNNVIVNVGLSKPINESLTVIVNDRRYFINSTDGIAYLELSGLSNGIYYFNVSLDDLNDYQCLPVSGDFTIDVKNTEIISSDLIITDEDDFAFNITLTDENGVKLANKNITFTLNNVTYNNVTNDDGVAYFLLDLDVGVYIISIGFDGDNDCFNTTVSNTVKIKTKVDFNVLAEVYQNNMVINISMSKPINESLSVRLNGRDYIVYSTNGRASLELSDLSNNEYDVTVCLDDEIYEFVPGHSNFTVDVKNTEIISSDLVTSEFSGDMLNITLVDENGNVLADKELSIVLNNLTLVKTTDSYGNVSVPINLTYGEYSIDINFKGDNNYFTSNQSANVKVKMNVDIDVSVNRSVNNAVVNVELSKPIHETLTVIISGKQHEVASINGKALLELYNLSNDIYNVTVSLDDKDNYNSLEVNSSFVIDVKKTVFVSNDLTITDEDHVDFNVTLTDENGVFLANKNITFILNGVSYDRITDKNGVAFIPVNQVGGTYDVVVGFAGDNDYFASNASNVIKVKTNVVLDVFVSITQNNAAIDINMSKCINESLTVIVNDKSYRVNSVDGNALLELLNLSNDVYKVIVGLDDKDNYNSLDAGSTFVIDVKSSVIQSEDLVIYDDDVKFNVTLTDENGVLLSNKNITFVLNGITYVKVTDFNGVASIPVDLAMGIYDVSVAFAGDNDYFASNVSNVITVKTNVDIGYVIEEVFDKTVINVSLSKNINGTLEILVDSKSYMIPVTVNASLALADLDAGTHNVKIRLLENSMYQFKDVSAQFNVSLKTTRLLAGDMITYYKSGQSYTVTLADEYGNPISGKEIHFKFSNNLFLAKTDNFGQAAINISLIDGSYDIFVGFDGDNNYYESSNVSKIHVKSTIIADGILNKTYGSYYSFKLLDIDGKPLKKVSVEYILDNVKFAGVSDNDGIVSVQITKQPCNYTLIVYNPVNNESLSKTINALKRIVQNTDITIYAYSGSVYKVQVLDDDGNPEAAGKIVTFKINGNTYSKKTVDNGYVSLSLSLAAKQYTITASYNGFKVSNKVNVKPVLTAKNVVKKKAKAYKFSAKLVDKNGKALKGKKLTFKIKGKKYTAKTNKKGVATITIRLSLKVGSYKIYTNYGKSKITNTLKIKK